MIFSLATLNTLNIAFWMSYARLGLQKWLACMLYLFNRVCFCYRMMLHALSSLQYSSKLAQDVVLRQTLANSCKFLFLTYLLKGGIIFEFVLALCPSVHFPIQGYNAILFECCTTHINYSNHYSGTLFQDEHCSALIYTQLINRLIDLVTRPQVLRYNFPCHYHKSFSLK